MIPSPTKLIPASGQGWAKPSHSHTGLSDCWSSTPGSGKHQDPKTGQQQCSRHGKIFGSEAAGLWPSVQCISWDETSRALSGMEVPVNSCVSAPVNPLNIYLHVFVISWQPNTILPCLDTPPAKTEPYQWFETEQMLQFSWHFSAHFTHPNWYTDTGTQGKHCSFPQFTYLLY